MDDISVFGDIMQMVMEIMEMEVELYGFRFSLWSAAVWDVMASVVVFFVFSALYDD